LYPFAASSFFPNTPQEILNKQAEIEYFMRPATPLDMVPWDEFLHKHRWLREQKESEEKSRKNR